MTPDTSEPTGSPKDYGFPEKPTAAQVTTWTNQESFLSHYSQSGAIYRSSALAGVSPRTFERWLETDNVGFQKRYEQAQAAFLEAKVLEIDRRAFDGTEKNFYNSKGEFTGSTTVYSDNLAMFRVKKLDPSYRDNYAVMDDVSAIRESLDALRQLGVPRLLEPQVVDGTATVVEDE